MASPEQFFDSGYPPRPAMLALSPVVGRSSMSLELTVPHHGSAFLTGSGTLRAEGYVTRGKPDRTRLKRNAAAVTLVGLCLAVPAETVDRAAGWATIAAFLLYLHDRSKYP